MPSRLKTRCDLHNTEIQKKIKKETHTEREKKNDFMHILWQYETLKTEHRLTSASSTVMAPYDKNKPHKLLSSKGLRLWNTRAIFRSNRETLNGMKWTIALTTNGFANIKNVSALLCFAYFCFYESFKSSFSFLLAILWFYLRGEWEKKTHTHSKRSQPLYYSIVVDEIRRLSKPFD